MVISDLDRAGMITGFDLELDFCLGIEDIVEKPKVVKKKKKKPKRSDSATRLSSESSLNSTNRSNFRQTGTDKKFVKDSDRHFSLPAQRDMNSNGERYIEGKLVKVDNNKRELYTKSTFDQKTSQLDHLGPGPQNESIKQRAKRFTDQQSARGASTAENS